MNPAEPKSGAEALVIARGLTKRFGDLIAVNNVDFDIRTGEVLGFLGPNGAGKTTTVRMITCTSPLSAGSLSVLGLNVASSPREIKAQLGVVPQDNNYDPDLTVMENLVTYGRYYGQKRSFTLQRARELLELVQLTDKVNQNVEQLSGGMKRRLVLARGLINQPRLLVLDEPTTGLDPQARRLIWQRIRELKRTGVTIIITTHYMDEAEQICDRLLIMDLGRIIGEGAPADLIERYAGREVLEIEPEDPSSPEFLQVISSCGQYQQLGDKFEVFTNDCPNMLESIRARSRLVSFGVRRATLEDVFIRLTGKELRD